MQREVAAPTPPTEAGGAGITTAPADASAAPDTAAPEPVREESPAPVTSSPRIQLRGRCIDADSDAPVAGCTISVPPNEARSDAAGRFELVLAEPPPQTSLQIRSERYAQCWMQLGALDPGHARDLGDIRLRAGVHVEGSVVEMDGTPIGQADVQFSQRDTLHFAHQELQTARTATASTDAAGRFRTQAMLASGAWRVEAKAEGRIQAEPLLLDLTASSPAPFVTIRMQAARSIRGRVVDEQGKPFDEVLVSAAAPGLPTSISTRPDADGTFCLYAPNATDTHTHLYVSTLPGVQRISGPSSAAWGDTGLEFVMRKSALANVTVRAFRSSDRAPVQAFDVRLRHVGSTHRHVPYPSRTTNGVAEFRQMEPGSYEVLVAAADPALRARLLPRFEVAPGQPAAVEAVLDTMTPWHVVVLDEARKPIAGATVELVEYGAGPDPNVAHGEPLHWQRGEYGPIYKPDWRPYHCLSHAETAADGQATLHRPASDAGLILLVRSPKHVLRRIDPPLFGTDPFEVVLETSASLEGEILGLDPAWRPHVILHREPQDHRTDLPIEVSEARTFALANLPTGRWQPVLYVNLSELPMRHSSSYLHAIHTGAPPLDVEGGGTHRVRFDVTGVRPASIRGRATVEGQVLRPATIEVRPAGRDVARAGATPEVPIAPDGQFELKLVAPRAWNLWLVIEQGDGRKASITLDDQIELAAGEALARNFDFPRRRLQLRVRTAAGKPPPPQRLKLVIAGVHYGGQLDTDGNAHWDFVPMREFRVEMDGRVLLKDVFPRGGGDLQREVVVPD